MTYADFKDLPRRTASDKVLCDKELNITKIQNMIDIKEVNNSQIYDKGLQQQESILVQVLIINNQQKNYTS